MSRRVVAASGGAALLLLLLARLPPPAPRPPPAAPRPAARSRPLPQPIYDDIIQPGLPRNETSVPTKQLAPDVSYNAVAGSDSAAAESDKTVAGSDKTIAGSVNAVAGSDNAVAGSDKIVAGSDKTVAGLNKVMGSSDKGSSVKTPASGSAPAPPPRQPGVVLVKDVYVSGHSVSHPELCPSLGLRTRLLVLVTSAPAHGAARAAVRLTWGHYALRTDVAMAFVLGQPPDELRASIEEEDSLYGDIIIGNFVDSYSNLTLKTVSMLEWADTFCPRAPRLLKTDDDMFINVPRLLAFIDAPQRANATYTIWGKVVKKSLPKRIPKSKYYLSMEQYPGRVFPDFTTGPAYLMTSDAARALWGAALGGRGGGGDQRYVRLEDVFVTGILASQLGIKRQHAPEFYNKKVTFHPCVVRRGVAVHMVRYHEQFELWRKLLDGRSKCS